MAEPAQTETHLATAIAAAERQADAPRLAALYADAARARQGAEARFLLTQAWVWSLVAGDPAPTAALEADLRALGGL